MGFKNRIYAAIAASFCMLMLILDAKNALLGARAGVELCYRTVIPSLFPFIVISIILGSNLTGIQMSILRPIGKLCGMPVGSESLLLLGLLGGYPVGAQGVHNAYANKSVSKQDAQRLLGFCSNAGPAFIFGMMGGLFQRSVAPWALWGIHILSAVIVGCILPKKSKTKCTLPSKPPASLTQALEQGLKTICVICGWIILFRILIAFVQRWILWIFPETMQILLIAVLELANGCCEMHTIANQGIRFIACSGILAFGGICVLMQTRSVSKDLGWGMYFPGKILQTVISILLASIVQLFLFPAVERYFISTGFYIIMLFIFLCVIAALGLRKKVVAFSDYLVYNGNKVLQSN